MVARWGAPLSPTGVRHETLQKNLGKTEGSLVRLCSPLPSITNVASSPRFLKSFGSLRSHHTGAGGP